MGRSVAKVILNIEIVKECLWMRIGRDNFLFGKIYSNHSL